jgi:hypothetical protein
MTSKLSLLEPPESLIDMLGGLFGHPHYHPWKPAKSTVRERDTRSSELVERLKAEAEAKRQRRKCRNLRHVMQGGYPRPSQEVKE